MYTTLNYNLIERCLYLYFIVNSEYIESENVFIENCTFDSNHVREYGGALALATRRNFPSINRPSRRASLSKNVTLRDK